MAERLPGAPLHLLPRRARLLGGVAFLRIPSELDGFEEEIGRLALEFYHVRSVYRVYGVKGVERRPMLKHLAGERVREVVHREYGCAFKLDVTRLMLCLGNSFERLRVAALTGEGEVVIDMFAGVGQFAIPIAVLSNPSRIYAIELNPEAYRYLVENVELNRVGEVVEPILGDCREVVEERLRGVADRVVMGYFGGTLEALPQALQALKPCGGVVHLHDLASRGGEEGFVRDVLEKASRLGYDARLLKWRRVKSYSKTRNHVVVDFFAVGNGSLRGSSHPTLP